MTTPPRGSKIFMTGGSGHVGTAIIEQALAAGLHVRSLSRSPASDAKLHALGAAEAAAADIVVHLADSLFDRPDNMANYSRVIATDAAAVDALALPLAGTDRPLLVTCGASGVRMVMDLALANKRAIYVGAGGSRTSTVHVSDAAALYLAAAVAGAPGDVFNCASDTRLTARRLAEAVGAALGVPAVSVSAEEGREAVGPLVTPLSSENRASSAKAVRRLGWKPTGPTLLEELETGWYRAAAREMTAGAAA